MTLEIPPLPSNAILLVEVGSTAHGTGLDGAEDHDEAGVIVEGPREVFLFGNERKTVMYRTQPEGVTSGPGDTDRTLYSLRTFIKLATEGNPSILNMFWSPVIKNTPEGRLLRQNGEIFIGSHIIPRFRGYMRSQVLQLVGEKGSKHGKRREHLIEQHGYDTKFAMHAARLGIQCLELLSTRRLELPMTGVEGNWLRALRKGEVTFEDFFEEILWLDRQLETIYNRSNYVDIDRNKIEELSMKIHNDFWDQYHDWVYGVEPEPYF